MANFFTDNEDLQFYFDRGLDWQPLVSLTEYGFTAPDGYRNVDEAVSFYRDIAQRVGEFSANEIAPHSLELDAQPVVLENGEAKAPPRLTAIFDQIKEMGLHGLCLPRELGGLNAPLLSYMINCELMARGDVSVMAHNSFHGGMAMAMLVYSVNEGTTRWEPERRQISETRFRQFIEEIAAGDAWGSMDITEPDAGSDMARLRAVGEQDADGNWFVTGEKIFITSGHGKYHFVIARTEKAGDPDDPFAGLGGLSMFLVPAYEDVDGKRRRLVELSRVEEKMGHHASVTASLTFDRAPAMLIGRRGEGFRYMLTLMNNARVGVGFESIGLCEAAYRKARDYAAERRSMGKTIDRHEMIADTLDEMRTDIQALRALAIHGAIHEELAQKYGIAQKLGIRIEGLSDTELARRLKHHRAQSRQATPLLKYLAAEKAVEAARRCIQIHGGNGYIREFGAEKLLRDALVMPIYEGTSQIQALMAMKDALGAVMKNPAAFARQIAQARWRSLSSRDPLERGVGRLQTAALDAQQYLVRRTATDKLRSLGEKPVSSWRDELTKNWNPKRDFAAAMLHAERLTRLLADSTIAGILLEQAKAHPDRRDVLERFLHRAEPRARFLLDEITTTGDRLLASLQDEPESAIA